MTKRDKKGRFIKGSVGNPKGRPKDGESWSAIIKAVGEMTPEEILDFIPKNNDLGRFVAKLPKDVQMKYLIIMRVYSSLMFEPSSSLFNSLLDRLEGKVKEVHDVDGTLNINVIYGDGNGKPSETP